MTDELNGETILEFVSLGVKNYGYRCTDGSQMVKVKGFTLTNLKDRKFFTVSFSKNVWCCI